MKIVAENGIAGSHQVAFRGYILRPLSIPGVYERMAARQVSKQRPKFMKWFFMPCWNTEFFLVSQMIKSAHCTITMDTKKAVWQVYSKIFRSLSVR